MRSFVAIAVRLRSLRTMLIAVTLGSFILGNASTALAATPAAPAATGPNRTVLSVPGGTFYVVPGGRAMDGSGFSVLDEGGVPMLSALKAVGGVEEIGYPISRRFWQRGAVYQVFERGVIRWRPAGKDGPAEATLLTMETAELNKELAQAAFKPELPLLPAERAMKKYGRMPLVVLDPGHGGRETGAGVWDVGNRIWYEKNANLVVALETEAILKEMGYQVEMTRRTDTEVAKRYRDVLPDKERELYYRDELQARIDYANERKADLFLSIHFNGGTEKQGGTEAYYCDEREHAVENRRFGELVAANLSDFLRGTGKPMNDYGLLEDSRLSESGKHEHLFLLGPTYKITTRPIGFPKGVTDTRIRQPSQMPAVLGESLYLTNFYDRELLDQPWVINTIARSYAAAITQYFAGESGSAAEYQDPKRPEKPRGRKEE